MIAPATHYTHFLFEIPADVFEHTLEYNEIHSPDLAIRQLSLMLACSDDTEEHLYFSDNLAKLLDCMARRFGQTHGKMYQETIGGLAYDIASHGF